MRKHVVLTFSVVLLIASGFATMVEDFEHGSHKVDPNIEKEVFQVLDNFINSFNARDRKAHYATYHFPHYRLASGKMTVLSKEDVLRDSTKFLERLVQAGWHHTQWKHRNIVQASENKVHVDTQFIRYRADGTELGTYESLYVLTYEDNRWAIKLRSSFAE